jgi:ABC-type multidrug transport system ATPase subunit
LTENTQQTLIEVKSLDKKFGAIHAVKNLSFSVKKGEVLGFLGPNGAGKSTTMKMITGFLEPTSGTVSVCGHDVLDEPILLPIYVGLREKKNKIVSMASSKKSISRQYVIRQLIPYRKDLNVVSGLPRRCCTTLKY